MSAEDYEIKVEEGAAAEGAGGGRRMCASLPDGVWCSLPGDWPLMEGARFTFGCDFRSIGGPDRVVTMEYRGKDLLRWVCEDRA